MSIKVRYPYVSSQFATSVKTAIIGKIAQPETLRADSTTPSQACSDSSLLYSPLEVLPLPRVQSQDNNELYSSLVESVVSVRQLEGEFADSGHVDKSKMWWFENFIMSSTVIEVRSNGYKLPFVQIPDSCFIPNIIVHYTKMNLSGVLSKSY